MTEPDGPVPVVVRGAWGVHKAFFWLKAMVDFERRIAFAGTGSGIFRRSF